LKYFNVTVKVDNCSLKIYIKLTLNLQWDHNKLIIR
jgi:hypothetical protein